MVGEDASARSQHLSRLPAAAAALPALPLPTLPLSTLCPPSLTEASLCTHARVRVCVCVCVRASADNPLVNVHLLGAKAEGAFKRPFGAANPNAANPFAALAKPPGGGGGSAPAPAPPTPASAGD